MNTEKLYITRKRKKWKFAHFDDWQNCFAASAETPQQLKAYFGNLAQPLVLEVGAGTADLSVKLAQKQPSEHFVAADIKSDRLYTGAKFALEHNLKNIAFVRAQMREVEQAFTPKSVKELWITFPDPFPRKKQAKRRLTHPQFLRMYARLLTKEGKIHFKTDNRELFLWSLEQIVSDGWQITELSFNLHESNLPEAYKLTTAYERRFLAEGTAINYITFQPS